jgi:hypothetical protein
MPRNIIIATAFAVCASVCFVASSAFHVSHSNTENWSDVNGGPMDAHDGNIIAVGDEFFMYAMGYTDCELETGFIPPRDCPGIYRGFGEGCGFRTDHTFKVWKSGDLTNWVDLGEALPITDRPEGIYFRPKVVFNKLTNLYVMWINYLPPDRTPLKSYPSAGYLVGTSGSPEGPFTIVSREPNLKYDGAGDLTISVDSLTGSAYVAYDAWSNSHTLSVELLSPDYLSSTQQSSGLVGPSSHEAPLLFQRGDYWYLLFGHTCCFCRTGSGLLVYTATSPLGPWNDAGIDVNPQSWNPLSDHTIPAQANYVFEVNGQYIYTGDLWTSASDNLKSHDIQYWNVIEFDDTKEPPMPIAMEWKDSFDIEI